jgi:protein O-GlcNAc transferase
LPNIDFFLSAELLEPPEAQKNYSEKLILLPGLGTHFESPSVKITAPSLQEQGIDGSVPILLCAGSPSKYLPSHDFIFVEIAKKLGKCQFVFFMFDENLSAALQERLQKVFLDAQLNLDQFIRFIPFQKREFFFGLMKKADIYLDTIGFSGFNTAMQAIFCDLPIVAIEGQWMRGRLASGILNRIGLSQLVCKTELEYINLVVEMIQNKDLLQSYKAVIAERKMNLFNDPIPIRALEDFLSHHIFNNDCS